MAASSGVPSGQPSANISHRAIVRSPRLRRLLILIACFVGSGLATFALFEFVLPGKIPQELVGRWRTRVKSSAQSVQMTLELHRHGAVRITVEDAQNVGVVEGYARVDGATLAIVSRDRLSGEEQTKLHHIHTATIDRLVLEDSAGNRHEFERLGPSRGSKE